jgi:hypothetical protein
MLYSASLGPGNGVGLGVSVGDGAIVAVLVTVGEGVAVGVLAGTVAVVKGSIVVESISATLSICWDPEHADRTSEISKTKGKMTAVLYAVRGIVSICGSNYYTILLRYNLFRGLFMKMFQDRRAVQHDRSKSARLQTTYIDFSQRLGPQG